MLQNRDQKENTTNITRVEKVCKHFSTLFKKQYSSNEYMNSIRQHSIKKKLNSKPQWGEYNSYTCSFRQPASSQSYRQSHCVCALPCSRERKAPVMRRVQLGGPAVIFCPVSLQSCLLPSCRSGSLLSFIFKVTFFFSCTQSRVLYLVHFLLTFRSSKFSSLWLVLREILHFRSLSFHKSPHL